MKKEIAIIICDLNLTLLKDYIFRGKLKYDGFEENGFIKRLEEVFEVFKKNKNNTLIAYDISCNRCNDKIVLFKGDSSPHFVILKMKENDGVIILNNCVEEFPDFNLNGLKLMRAYELMIGIKHPDPTELPDLFGDNMFVLNSDQTMPNTLPDITVGLA